MGCCQATVSHSELQVTKGNLPPRPSGATGPFLRLLSINDVYTLENYARFASAVTEAKKQSSSLRCVVTSHLSGDFLGPCLYTSLDGGATMVDALNYAKLDYVSLGNHEFDGGKEQLKARLQGFKGKLLNTNGVDAELKHLPPYDVVEVGDKKVLIVGLCIADPQIYSANSCPEMKDFVDSCMAAWEDACRGQHIDLVVPMTHQLIDDDRLLAEQFEMHETMNGKAPVILGGHEHTVFEEVVADSLIVKTGQDASKIAVVDVWWTSSGVKCQHVLLDANIFPAQSQAAAWAAGKKKFVEEAMEAPIMELPSDMSTQQVRFGESGLASLILQHVKRGILGAEVVMINGGDVRGRRDYKAGTFTLGELYKEIPYDEVMALVEMPGATLQEVLRFSRTGEGQKPQFLHLDSHAKVDEKHQLLEVNQRPFDAKKTYKVAVSRALLLGMDNITPLKAFGEAHGVPDEEMCRGAKDIIVTVCMKDLWRRMLEMPLYDQSRDLKHQELREAVRSAFAKIDKNKSGQIELKEIEEFLKTRMPAFSSPSLILQLIKTADQNNSGSVDLAELVNFVH